MTVSFQLSVTSSKEFLAPRMGKAPFELATDN